MVITEKDLVEIPKLLDAVQVFEDNQIRCKDIPNHILALREPGNQRAIIYLEGIVGKGNVSNKTLRKVLAGMHQFVLSAAKSGLGVYVD